MMMNNMFSMFDPQNKKSNPFLIYYLFMNLMENSYNKKTLTLKNIMNSELNKMNKTNMSPKNLKTTQSMLSKTSIMILFLNLISLTPYSWSSTSQPSNNIPTILMLMIPIIIMTMMKNKNFLIHLTPISTPNMLIPIMIMIETTSWLIRPITLTLRLTANIMSGHILLYIISSKTCNMYLLFSTPITVMMYPLIILEFMVSIIQAYIIMTLTSLYIKEI